MKLSIVIPLYNETNTICAVLDKIENLQLKTIITDYEVVVVDDCSSDNSWQKVKEFIADKKHIKLLKHETNKGKGAAVKTGIENSTGDVIFIQDADLELSPSDLPVMIKAMQTLKVDFVNGSRYSDGVLRPLSSYKRYLANKLFTWFTAVIIDVRITDMACGYKLFTRDLYNKIKLQENRFGFEAELIIKAMRIKKNNIVEVPVQYFPRNEGDGKKLKNSDAFKILWTIIKYGILWRK